MKFIQLLALFILISWCVNLYKFTQYDFQPSYRAEIIRTIGIIIPITAVVFAYFDIEDRKAHESS